MGLIDWVNSDLQIHPDHSFLRACLSQMKNCFMMICIVKHELVYKNSVFFVYNNYITNNKSDKNKI
jgi:hypothetical protein